MKICKGCALKLDFEFFYKNKTGYYHPYCKSCNRLRSRDWKRNNTQKHYLNKLKEKFKITPEEYSFLMEKYNQKCGICFKNEDKRRLNVDHCHVTGKVRGILCRKCNLAIGYLGDDIGLLKNAILYLNEGTKI